MPSSNNIRIRRSKRVKTGPVPDCSLGKVKVDMKKMLFDSLKRKYQVQNGQESDSTSVGSPSASLHKDSESSFDSIDSENDFSELPNFLDPTSDAYHRIK